LSSVGGDADGAAAAEAGGAAAECAAGSGLNVVAARNRELEREVETLRGQLAAAGHTPVDCVPLDVAEANLRDAVRRLMEGDAGGGGGGDNAEREIERWDRAVRAHPDFAARERAARDAWQREHRAPNARALRATRALVPADVSASSAQSMIDRGLPRALARRVWAKKALWLARIHVDDIRKVHVADLQVTTTNTANSSFVTRSVARERSQS